MSQPNRTRTTPDAPSSAELAFREAAWGSHTARSYAPADPRLLRPAPPALSTVVIRAAQRRSHAQGGQDAGAGGFGPVTMLFAIALALLLTAVSALAIAGWPVLRQWRVDLVLGNELAGFERVADDSGLAAALAAARGPDAMTGMVSGVFQDPNGVYPPFAIVAGKALQLRPAAVVRAELAAVDGAAAPVDVHPGGLGGHIRCALIRHGGGTGTVCVWADHGTRGVGFLPGRPVPEGAELFGRVRQQMIVR